MKLKKNCYKSHCFVIIIISSLLCTELKAQVKHLDGELGNISFSYPSQSIPKEFSYDDVPSLILSGGKGNIFNIYDENLELVKSIDISNYKSSFDYQLTYQREEREVTKVSIKEEYEESLNMTLDEFISREKMINPNLTDDNIVITISENGDKIITFKSVIIPEYERSQYYAYYEFFGEKYPKIYFRCRDENVSRIIATYTLEYSEWKAKDTYTEDRHVNINPLRLMNINLNSGETYFRAYFYLSQTLFNNDEEFEYIIPKYVLTKGEDNGENSYLDTQYGQDYDNLVLTRSNLLTENATVALSGFQIVASNGAFIKDFDFDEGPLSKNTLESVCVVSIGDKRYLAFGNSNQTYFYTINRETSDIRKARSLPATFSISPTVVDKNTTISINLGDSNKNGSYISLFSSSGEQKEKIYVPAGDTQAFMNVKTSPGVYLVSRISDGKNFSTKKILVK